MAKTSPTPTSADEVLSAATSSAPVIERPASSLNAVRTDEEGRQWVTYVDPETGETKEREVIEPTEEEMAAARGGNVTHTYPDGSTRVGCPPFPAESPLQAHQRQIREAAEKEDPSLIGLAERQQRTPEQMGITTASNVNQRQG